MLCSSPESNLIYGHYFRNDTINYALCVFLVCRVENILSFKAHNLQAKVQYPVLIFLTDKQN